MLNFPSTADTDSPILSVDEASISCTSGTGNETKVSPILYLKNSFSLAKAQGIHAQHTGFCRLHPLAPTRWTAPQDPLCPSAAFISTVDVVEMATVKSYSFSLKLLFQNRFTLV